MSMNEYLNEFDATEIDVETYTEEERTTLDSLAKDGMRDLARQDAPRRAVVVDAESPGGDWYHSASEAGDIQ